MSSMVRPVLVLTVSNVATRIIALFFFIILTRVMSVSDYGFFRYLFDLSGIYAIAFTGLTAALTKYISEQQSGKREISEYLTATTVTSVCVFVVLVGIGGFFTKYGVYLGLFIFAILVDAIYLSYFRGLLNYTKLAGFKLLENIIQLSILVASYLIIGKINFTFAVIFFSFSPILSAVIFEAKRSQVFFARTISKKKARQLVKFSIPLTMGSIGWIVMFGVNTIFIEHFYNTEQVGFFSVGMTISQIFTFLPAAIATILLPKISSMKDKSKIGKPIVFIVAANLIISFIILIPLHIFSEFVVVSIFKESYLPSIQVILPLALGQIAISLHQVFASVWQGLGRPIIPTITISIAAALNLIGSYFLTQSHGIWGTSFSNAITSWAAFIGISTVFFLKRKTLPNKINCLDG